MVSFSNSDLGANWSILSGAAGGGYNFAAGPFDGISTLLRYEVEFLLAFWLWESVGSSGQATDLRNPSVKPEVRECAPHMMPCALRTFEHV